MINKPSRPLRVPEYIEMCAADPPCAKADERGSWTLSFVLAQDVSPGEDLWLHVHGGRNGASRWPGFQAQDESAEGYLSLRSESGTLTPRGATDDGGVFCFETPPVGLKQGDRLRAELGGPAGIPAPKFSVSSRFFLLHKVPAGTELRHPLLYGERPEELIGLCMMDVSGSDPISIRVHAPSTASHGESIALLVRPEDKNYNLACAAPGELLVQLDGLEIPAERIAVEGSNCCRLEGIALPGEGVYRLEVADTSNGFRATANPIRVPADGAPQVLWGSIHGHTQVSDGTGSLDRYFSQMRDECAIDFGSTADHDHGEQITDEIWALSQEAVARYNEPGRFTAFLGYEWAKWRKRGDGDRNVYYLRDRRPMYRSDDDAYPSPPDLFRALKEEEALVIPHHPAHIGNHNDWKDHNPSKERLVEIYSYWGCSERSIEDGNILPGSPVNERNPNSGINPLGYVQRALAMGWRVGFIAASDDHSGHPSDGTVRIKPTGTYTGGLAAVYARENTREAIFEALYDRRCYGTTGARIIADFSVSGHPMGSEVSLSEHPGLADERRIKVSVHGTSKIKTIEIVRNNADVHTVRPDGPDAEFEWLDSEPLGGINLPPAEYSAAPFTFYYIRVTQEDNQIAWLSPVWISQGVRLV
ncbi:MAG: DUF3604 domain-containing protein [Armatimonadetes bacterium]|nr:DUF3604 domain-containing protein [Armatimonadota bacterium]